MNRAPFAVWMTSSRLRFWVGVAALAAVYFWAAKLGLSLAFSAEQITLVWPPAGIALAAVLLFGYRVWPGIALGAFLANATTAHETMATAAGIAVGNTLEAVVGAYLLDRFVGFRCSMERLKDVLGLAGFAALGSTTVSATVGVSSLCLGGVHSWARFGSLWPIWWLGDAIGDLIVAPVVLVWASSPRVAWQARRIPEAVGLLAALVLTSLIVFADFWAPATDQPLGLKFLMFPIIIWAAVRFGQLATTAVSLIVSVIAMWSATHGLGPFGSNLNDASLAVLQSFMGVLAVSGMLLSAAMAERNTSDRHRAAGYAVTSILAEAPSLEAAVPRIIAKVCETLRWDVGAVWRVDDASQLLRCVAVWHQPSLAIPEFEAATRHGSFPRGIGLPGRVWASGEPAWIADVVRDANFPRASIAANDRLHGAFGFPIRLHDHTRGVIEFFSREIQEPDEQLLQLMTTLGGQIGQFIERKRNEDALRTAQLQLQTVTETMAAAVTRCSRDLRYVWVSRGYAEMIGRPSEKIIGKPIVEIIGTAAFEAIRPRVERVLRGERVEYEDRVDYKGIGSRWMHAVYVPTYDATGTPDGWVAVVTDHTRRKELEDASRRLAAIVESSDDAIIANTLEGMIVSWNPAAQRLYGYTATEIVGQPVAVLASRDRADEVAATLDRVRKGAHIEQLETIRRRKDDTLVDVSLTISPIKDAHGAIIGACTIARDITERKRHERELQEGARRKDEFLGMLAHELRNPLAVISNASQVLERNGTHDAPSQKLRAMITRQTQVLVRIVDDLLDVSRISRGKIQLDKQPIEVSKVTLRAVEAMRWLIEAKHHDLELTPIAEPIWVEADPTRLEQILANLLSNAVKYTDPGGRISLSVTRENADVLFTVRDTGTGISPEMLLRVFDLFAQADDSIARSQGGLGIGLFLVQSLTKMHGGSVSAWSDGPGKGSVFTVRLPALERQSQCVSSPDSTPDWDGPRLRVLVVDDNMEVAESVVMLMRSFGHDAVAVYTGMDCVETARRERPDVMLVDLGMPEMDGYEVARRVRAQPELSKITLCALSGYGSLDDQRRAYESGFDAHLIKPLDISLLRTMLGRIAANGMTSEAG